jgi:GMC oxidoreductase
LRDFFQLKRGVALFSNWTGLMTARNNVSIAIIGSGLSSSLLAKQLAQVANVTVFERGGDSPQKPRHVETGRPLGLSPSYGHGLGGTTNYWVGGMLRLRPGETTSDWPVGLQQALACRENEAIACLYGRQVAEDFARDVPSAVEGDVFVDHILRPSEPFRAARSGYFNNADLKLRHEVLTIREDGNKGIVRYKLGDKILENQFDIVVLAAGNFGSPLILARSGLGGPVVGHNITDHPMGFVAKMSANGPNRFGELAPISRGRFEYWPLLKVKDSQTGLWTSVYLRPAKSSVISSDPYADSFDTLAQTSRFRKYWKAISRFGNADFRTQAISFILKRATYGQHVFLMVLAEQESRGQGTLAEKNGIAHLDWSISDQVVASIERSIAVAADWAGATAITYAKGDLRDRLWTGAHHSGGCRISEDPASGVVDENLRVHGTKSIYVCDGSVLPSTGSTNTGLTISCLALRLSSFLTAPSSSKSALGLQ